MKLNDNSLQWIYDNIDRYKEAVVALDFAKKCRCNHDDTVYKRADKQVHDLAFSFLMVAMGESIPKTLWSADDYSVLYGLIMNGDTDITNDG